MSIRFDNYAKKIESKKIKGLSYDWYRWRVFVDAPDEA